MWRCPALFACKGLTGFLIVIIFLSQWGFLQYLFSPVIVEAAQVTIDATTSTDANSYFFGGSQTVFVSDTVGYKFYRDSNGSCVYSKTTTGGTSWNSAVTVDARTDCGSMVVWYDQWTPGDSGNYIHIATMETSAAADSLYYNRLDTTSDTLWLGSSPVNATTNSGQVPTLAVGTNNITMTKSTTGDVLIATADASDAFVVHCSTTCNNTANWTEAGSAFLDVTNDWNLLVPLLGGKVMIINRDTSADDMRSRVWNGASWSGLWTTFDANAIENATYDTGMAATVDPVSGDVYLVYAADNDQFTTLDHDIRTAKYSSNAWSNTADVFTNIASRGLTMVAVSMDTNTNNIYVGYVLRTTPATATTGNVYWSTSTSAMSSWSTAQGPVNSTAGDFRGLDMNTMSDERIFISWYDPSPDDMFGDTIADIAPAVKVYANGTATSTVIASSSNVYVGGQYAIRESQASRNVTTITVTERGTVNANTNLKNIKLRYDLDTTAPYDCTSESYSGSESQFGTTDADGFSGSNGTSTFSGLVSISPTQSMCVYAVVDVSKTAVDGDTLSITIESPNNDVVVTGGQTVMPITAVQIASSTVIKNSKFTQTHYHWRNDDGNETGATSVTGGVQDTDLSTLLANSPRRLRVQVSNEGSITATTTRFRLEYATAAPTCEAAASWIDVNATNDAWNMYNSSFVTNGNNTTNIAVGNGGVTDENTTFLTPNDGIRDTSSETGSLTLTSTNFVELEFSIVASTSAHEGTTYCFRLTDNGQALPVYDRYPSATIAADVSVAATGTQVSSLIVPTTNAYVGGKFVIKENVSTRTVSNITIAEDGTINANTNLKNIKLRYDLDTTAPYDCTSESYSGSESQFGTTDADGFSGPNGTSTFSGSVGISTTTTMCIYAVFDVEAGAHNGETIHIGIQSPTNDVVVSSGSVSPSESITLTGTTTLSGSIITQTNYHWRNDNGNETGATSATLGMENTPLTNHSANTPIRLRIGISNEGYATSVSRTYRLEFGPKVTTCDMVAVWTPVGSATDDWDMYDSINITNGNNTTNIANGNGGITDENVNFLVSNAGVRDTTSTTTALVLATNEYTEFEFSITSTNITLVDSAYCFRLTGGGEMLPQYTNYAEIRTAPKRDFKVQQGVAVVTGTSTTLVAGVDYVAPSSTSTAFVRITDTHFTGAGKVTAGGGAQNADDTTAYISQSNLLTSFTISRPTTAINNTRVTWEIVEFIADPGTDNEMKVLGTGTMSLASASTSATGTTVSGVTDDADVVVFITGIQNRNTGRNFFYASQVTTNWDANNNLPTFLRGSTGAIVDVSYAVVEYSGINWNVQRIEHTYASSTITETEAMNPVNSLERTFIHAQKRISNLSNVNNFGHEVWLSSIGAVSFQLESAATTPSGHTSVAWVIENMQTSAGAMVTSREKLTIPSSNSEPYVLSQSIIDPVSATDNTSIFATSRVVGANSNFPLVFAGARITSTSTYEVWRSEASADMVFRSEIVEWPTSGLAVRQNYYRLYADNNTVTPTDPWPPGVTDLGENSPITVTDSPLGENEHVRLRMTLRVANATLPSGLYVFRLQYGLRTTSCATVGSWTNLGDAGSGELWRGYAATGTTDGVSIGSNPPNPGELLISVSDRVGSLIEDGTSPSNPYPVDAGEDVEYEWFVEQNGAAEKSVYCFRMVHADGTPLDGYFNYPQIRTAGFTPQTKNWRFYDDAQNETPATAMANEIVAPTEVQNGNVIALRVTVGEQKHVRGIDTKFSLQYDEDPNFTHPTTLVASSSCTATSTWCYADGGGQENATITTKVLSDADTCVSAVGSGCGTHNRSAVYAAGHTHNAGANAEYAFYLKHAAARAGAVYYFRLYDVYENLPVPAASGEVYPSLVAETPKLSFTVSGLPSGTSTAGVTTTVSTTPTAIAFGSIAPNTNVYAAHRIGITTNATDGYRIYTYARQQLINSYGVSIPSVTGSNAIPVGWSTGCTASATGCVGYHSTDATLLNGSTRFSPLDSYAGLHTALAEIMYSPIPGNESHDMLYRVLVRSAQPAGDYETEIVYIALPVY